MLKTPSYFKRRTDLEIRELEAVWVELRVKGKTVLLGGFYTPPNSNNAYFNLISESVDRAYNTNISDIIIRIALEGIYIGFIRLLLEYSDSVWDNCSTECKKKKKKKKKKINRIVCGAALKKNFLQSLDGEIPKERRTKHKLVIFYKIVNGLTPDNLSDLVPPHVGDSNPYILRNANDIHSIRARTNLFSNSFFPSTIRAWITCPKI